MRDYDIAFSMGSRCGCSQALRAARLQLASYPLDWVATPGIVQSAEMIARDFAGWLERDEMELVDVRRGTGTINRAYLNRRTGIVFGHDFHHDSDIDTAFDAVAAKYDRRIARLLGGLRAARRALAVYVERPARSRVPDEEVIRARQILADKFPDTAIDLLYVFHADGLAAPVEAEIAPGVFTLADAIRQFEYGFVSHTFDREGLVRYLMTHARVPDTRTDEEKRRFDEAVRSRRDRRFGTGGAFSRWWTKQQYRLHRKLEHLLRERGILPIDRPFPY